MAKNRQMISPDMYPKILETYSEFYANASEYGSLKEVGEYLNIYFSDLYEENYNFDESAYRKTYRIMKKGIEQGIQKGASEKEIKRIANARTKLKKEGAIISVQKSIVNKEIKQISFKEFMIEEILSAYKDYSKKDYNMKIVNNAKQEEYALYSWADFHYGAIVELENKQRKTKNIYDTKIAIKTFENFINYIIKDVKENNYKHFGILGLSDDIEGNLRPSSMLHTLKTMTEQTLECSDVYINGVDLLLNNISQDCTFDLFFVNSSNHGQLRMHNSKRDEVTKEDMSLIIADQLIKAFRDNDRVNVVTDDVIIVNILGKKVAMLHGQQHKRATMFEDVNKKYSNIDYVLIGHYHSFAVDGYYSKNNYVQQTVRIPSMIGDTDHANRLGYSECPQALKLIFNKKYGINNFTLIPVR